MARKKANYPLIEGLEITSRWPPKARRWAAGREVVVFVPMTVPGDVVDVQIRVKRRRYMEGTVVRYVKRSPRTVPNPSASTSASAEAASGRTCPTTSSGCASKTGQVRDQLTRIGKIELPEVAPASGRPETRFYRNKLEYTFADRRWLTREGGGGRRGHRARARRGIPHPGHVRQGARHPPVLAPARTVGTPSAWRQKRFCIEHGYTFHNAREHTGFMRNMVVRTASTGEVMVIVVFGADDRERIAALLDHLAAAFPAITSLMYVVNTKWNDSTGDLEAVCYRGKDHIIERMEGLPVQGGAQVVLSDQLGPGLRTS